MNQKTILEELLEHSPEEKKRNNMLDSALRLSAKGRYDEAAEIFAALLASNPEDHDAARGKKLNDRRRNIDGRISRLDSVQTSEAKRKPALSLLRSQKVQTALVAAFALICALTAATLGL